ncbi:MAG: hypothetical protein NZM26_02395 [Patescibacteria group bacterium]|nr:hypothetical protein [Patescibacteria group bacterium]
MYRIFVLFVQFGDQHRTSGIARIKKFLADLGLKKTPLIILVIDNSIEKSTEIVFGPHEHFISGDDSTYEFSGWDKGIKYIERHFCIRHDDLIILANDTFHRNYGDDYLQLFLKKQILLCRSENFLYGYKDAYPKPVSLFGLTVSSWLRSSFLICSYATLNMLRPLAIPFANDILFSKNYKQFFHDNVPLSNNYKQYLRTWLFGEKDPTGEFQEKWHSQRPLTQDNFSLFKGKTRAILSEHYLSARALNKGIKLLGVNEHVFL